MWLVVSGLLVIRLLVIGYFICFDSSGWFPIIWIKSDNYERNDVSGLDIYFNSCLGLNSRYIGLPSSVFRPD
jgi:hypothetical protein